MIMIRILIILVIVIVTIISMIAFLDYTPRPARARAAPRGERAPGDLLQDQTYSGELLR